MTSLPSSKVTVSAASSASLGDEHLICVITPAALSDDGIPRFATNPKVAYDTFGYCPGVEYVYNHAETGRPFAICGVPIATPGAVDSDDDSGNTGTSVSTLTVGGDGVLFEHAGALRVQRGGTVGTDYIVLDVSCDGQATWQTLVLGTQSSAAIPYMGLTANFAAGTLVTGDVIHTWAASGPQLDAAGLLLAFNGMKAQQRQFRTILHATDFADATAANAFEARLADYDTSMKRPTLGRGNAFDIGAAQTKTAWALAVQTAFESVAGKPLLALGMGRGRWTSPLTGWAYRYPFAWDASLREYAHDLHVVVWRTQDGPLRGDLWDPVTRQLVEWDDAVDGESAAAARFGAYRTWENEPRGAFANGGWTRATPGDIREEAANVQVINVVKRALQARGVQELGGRIELKRDGSGRATKAWLGRVKERCDAAMQLAIRGGAEGRRAATAAFFPNADSDLSGATARLTGVGQVQLDGLLFSFDVELRVS